MNTYSPLFLTGTARSGTTLLCKALSVHSEVMLASDPYLHLFRSLRNDIVSYSASEDLKRYFNPGSSFQDFYFLREHIAILDIIQKSDLQIPFNLNNWTALYESLISRAGFESPDLIPELHHLQTTSYLEMFNEALRIISVARRSEHRAWVGFKELWIIDYFALLAHAYPQAHFIVIQRDPRAILASMLAMAKKDPTQKANVLSCLRHWRKYAAFNLYYQQNPLITRRLHILKYEDLIRQPEQTLRKICDFLKLSFEKEMLDSNNYVDYSRGGSWKGNSSYETKMENISMSPLEQWRTNLDMKTLKTIEFICGPEMKLEGYAPITGVDGCDGDVDILNFLIQDSQEPCSWRSDFGDIQQDYGFELFRRDLLAVKGDLEIELIRRSFLFEKVYRQLRNMETGIK